MNTAYLMILLTANSAGQIGSAFVTTDTLQQCEQKIGSIQAIFSSQQIPVLEARCIPGEIRFTPFSHGNGSPPAA